MGPECAADPEEPNYAWPPLVRNRRARGGAELAGLTLLPGDEDWFVFEVENLSLNVHAEVRPGDHCAGWDERVCVDLWLYGWAADEDLIDGPDHLRGPVCGRVSSSPDSGAPFGVQSLAGEPWIAVLVHVYRDGAGDRPVAYELSFTH